MNKLIPYALLLLGGFFYALGFPSFIMESFLIGPILGFTILFYYLASSKVNQITAVIFFSAGFNFLGFYWIPKTIHVFGEINILIAFFLGLFFSLIILPQLWAMLLLKYLVNKSQYCKKIIYHLTDSQKVIYFAVLITLLEYYTPQQFPAHIGHGWLIFPKFIGMATTFGATFYSFLNFLIASILVILIKHQKILVKPLLLVLTFLIISPIDLTSTKIKENAIANIRIVQANIGNFMKVHAERGGVESISEVFKRYMQLSTKEAQEKLDLIIWPETAYPYSFVAEKVQAGESKIPELMESVATEMQSQLLVGGYDRKSDSSFGNYFETEYNSTFHIDSNSNIKGVYHKRVLIPFGETLPFPQFINDYLSYRIRSVSFFARGEKYTRFNLNNQLSFITPICYEILYSNYIQDYYQAANAPDFMINLTNDSWYGDTTEPHQHLFLAKWRAIEFRTPLIRSTNTGITSIIFPDGSESKRLNIYEQNSLDTKLDFTKKHTTLFSKYGMLNAWLLFFIIFLFGMIKLEREIPLSKDRAA